MNCYFNSIRPYILGLTIFYISNLAYAQNNTLLIQDINCIDVENGQVNARDVLIQNGSIKDIGKLSAPSDAQIVNGKDKYLMPGMVDGHIHLFQSGGIYTRPDVIDLRKFKPYEEERQWLQENAHDLLRRYLRCGITTVVDVGGPMYNYDIRDKYKGDSNYPNIFLTGPLVSTYQPAAFDIEDSPIIKVNSKEEAIALVHKQAERQPDFIKIWYIALPNQTAESTYEIIEATIKESHQLGYPVTVHATQLNTAKLAVKAGADILVHSVDDPIDQEFIKMLEDNKVSYIPTLVVHGNYIESFINEPLLTNEDFKYANPHILGTLFDPRHLDTDFYSSIKPYAETFKAQLRRQDSIRQLNLKMLSNTNVNITTGTDAGNIGTMHASSFFEELKSMQNSGLTNLQILQASTINAAKMLGQSDQFGQIKKGLQADLIILNDNPIEDLKHLQEPAFVIKSGHLMKADSIVIDSSVDLAQKQLNAYNARKIDPFLEPYSDDVEIYNFPDVLSAKGKENIRPGYASMFENLNNLHCELVNRIDLGNTVIDREKVRGFPGREFSEVIAVYKIEDGKIARVYFIR